MTENTVVVNENDRKYRPNERGGEDRLVCLNKDLFELHKINRSLSTSELEIISYSLESISEVGDETI